MPDQPPGSTVCRAAERLLRVALLGCLLSRPALAIEWGFGEHFKADLKTELSIGMRLRMEEPDARLIGKLNLPGQQNLCDDNSCDSVEGNAHYLAAPGNTSQDLDNGNLNYEKHDIVAAPTRLKPELKLSYRDFSLHTRGVAYYDRVNQDFAEFHPNTRFQPASTPRPQAVERDLAERADLLEAYVSGDLPFFGGRQLNIRVGEQILYWGESNFLGSYSLNSINPPDLNRIQMPGADLDEYFTPVPMVQLSSPLTPELKLAMFYEYGWEPVEIEPVGSFFSSTDNAGTGGGTAHQSGKLPEDPMNQARPIPPPRSNSGRTIYRLADRRPENGGQYGAQLKYFAPALGEGTEFGLYYANYHSRSPITSFVAAQASSCRSAPEALDNVAGGAAVFPFCVANGEVAPVDTLRYFLEYPEDIRMFGATVVTTRGPWSFQAEYAYRPNVPFQVDKLDLAFAGLQPAFPRQDVPALDSMIPNPRRVAPDFVETRYRRNTVQAGQYIRGYERMAAGQLNLSTLLLTPRNPFGASQLLLLLETGLTHVRDFPELDELQFEGLGTSNHHGPGIDGTGASGQTDINRANPTQQVEGFATKTSWGWRVLAELEYPALLFGLTFRPFTLLAHDVDGTAPGNGGNFIEGRKQVDLGLRIESLEYWSTLLQYTRYSGAAEFNLLRDRDNLALSVILNF